MTSRILFVGFLLVGCAAVAESQTSPDQPTPVQVPSPTAPETMARKDLAAVPSGTEIVVRTNQGIDASEASEGQTYSAEVVDDVRASNGQIVIPQHSKAELIVSKVSNGGTTGSSELALALHSIVIDGR